MNEAVKILINGKEIAAKKGTRLSCVTGIDHPCGGRGACGKCKVIAKGELSPLSDAEREHLTDEEIAADIRLSCLTYAMGDCEIKIPDGNDSARILIGAKLHDFHVDPTFNSYGVAVDIGTTTVAAALFDKDGRVIADASALNPQSRFGADVISRIEAELAGKGDELASAIRAAIDKLILKLSEKAKIDAKKIDGAVITGNTVMLSLLTKTSTEPLSHAPFVPLDLFGYSVRAKELELGSLMPEAVIYLPPCISAFVGADITCAILSSKMAERNTAMLIDIGTNGEIALWRDGRVTACSTAAGPAFEGVGISHGMRAEDGAIDKVEVKDGRIKAHVIGDAIPRGICGSGLVDAICAMLEVEATDESGYLESSPFPIYAPVTVSQNDVRAFQLAKSAICAGILTLCKEEKLNTADIDKLYIAGGFGCYLNTDNAQKLGLLPRGFSGKTEAIGNAALGGAAMLLCKRAAREEAEALAKSANTVELASSPTFVNLYTSGMFLESAE